MTPGRLLRRLEEVARTYGPRAAAVKVETLDGLARARLRTAEQVLRLHEALCFLRAYPDDREVLGRVERMLAGFGSRRDLLAQRDALVDSGIAGTAIRYRFYWPVARWLASRWPDRLRLDPGDGEWVERLAGVLPRVLTPAENETPLPADGDPLARLRSAAGSRDTDAVFLVRRIAALPGDEFTREAVHDGLDAGYVLASGSDTPGRGTARLSRAPVVFRARAPERGRPDLRRAVARPPRSVASVGPADGSRLIDLALGAMITRARDLEAFGHGDPRDVRVVDDGDGLQFVWIGVRPPRRRLLHATYGGLMLRNGVPIGYVQVDPLLGNAGVSYNTFETFRGAEAAFVFGRMLASVRAVFGAARFSVEPYQLGHGNDEGLESGAWWFYAKLGFLPRDPEVLDLARREMRRVAARAGTRTSLRTLRRLAAAHVFLDLSRRGPSLPPPPWSIGLRLGRRLADLAGADRERGLDAAAAAAAARLGGGPSRGWRADESEAWRRWAPLVLELHGVERWSRAERRAAVEVIRAKGGRRESDFLARLDAHAGLRRALARAARVE